MNEGDYHQPTESHWMALTRLWLPYWPPHGKPHDYARWESMRRLFDHTPVDQIRPLIVVRMIGEPYRNMYMVLDGHHRVATARERGIGLLPVRIWRLRPLRSDLMTTKCHLTFDRV